MNGKWALWALLLITACPSSPPSADKSPGPPSATTTVGTPSGAHAPSVVPPSKPKGPEFERFVAEGIQGLIVGESKAGRFYFEIAGDSASGYFTPTQKQIIGLEKRVFRYIKRKAPKNSSLKKGLFKHKRQYVGFVREGRRLILASFFCDTAHKDWTRKPIVVKDGGECYFQVEYDPEERDFMNLSINGEG